MKTKSDYLKKIIFPLILILYPLYRVGLGADLSDTTYSLGNYLFFDNMAPSWKYATFFSNLLGHFLLTISGKSMLVMNILCSLIVSAIAVLTYRFLVQKFNYIIVFLAETVAICLSWCPNVILYNYLTYFVLTLAIIIFYKGIVTDNSKLYVIAGALLGLNVFVRISNIVEAVFIVVLWYGNAILKNKKAVKNTLHCLLGFFIGIAAGLIIIVVPYGISGIRETVEWATGLFSSGDSAGGYSLTEMLSVIFVNYLHNLKYFILSLVVILLGIGGFKFCEKMKIFEIRLSIIKKSLYVICVFILFFYFYRNGVFTTKYYNNGAIFGIAVLTIFFMYAIFLLVLFCKRYDNSEKILAALMLVNLIVTPLGSNNHLFTIINNMYIVLPVAASFAYLFIKRTDKKIITFPVSSFLIVMGCILLIQSLLFYSRYVFVDGEQNDVLNTKITAACNMNGMKTSGKNADAIDGLVNYMDSIEDYYAIYYGNIPGVAYLLDTPSFISTSWPDLDSYSIADFKAELDDLKNRLSNPDSGHRLIFIIKSTVYDNICENGGSYKDKMMMDCMHDLRAENIYKNELFYVYLTYIK